MKFVDGLGLIMVDRDEHKITLENPQKVKEEYEVLANFPFSSDTKRMGIVVKHISSGRIIFYLKGAETVIEECMYEKYVRTMKEACENLSMEGLRTLVITQRVLSQEEFD